MEDNLKCLVEVYAANKRSILDSDDGGPLFEKAFEKLYPGPEGYLKYIGEPWYRNNKEIISQYKKVLEDKESVSENSKSLMINCLNYVFNECVVRDYDSKTLQHRIEILEMLILESYKKKWNDKQIEHFKNVLIIFRDYYSFFISYTNHEAKIINYRYKSFNEIALKKDDLTENNLENKNLLAWTFYARLGAKSLKKGFIDIKNIRQGDLLDTSVMDSVSKSFAFIQLISTASFVYSDNNWSFGEYKKHRETHSQQWKNPPFSDCFNSLYFYFIIEEDAFPNEALIEENYKAWKNLVATKTLHKEVYKVKDFDQFDSLIKTLVDDIIIKRDRLIQEVPD